MIFQPRPEGLRRDELIALASRWLILRDVEKLQEIAGFNQDYLLLDGAPAEVRSYLDMLELDRRGVCESPHESHRERTGSKFRTSSHSPIARGPENHRIAEGNSKTSRFSASSLRGADLVPTATGPRRITIRSWPVGSFQLRADPSYCKCFSE